MPRATVRLNWHKMRSDTTATPPTDMIYYLKTEVPHLHEFSTWGPSNQLDRMAGAVRQTLKLQSPGSVPVFDEAMAAAPPTAFEHIIAPLDGDRTVKISL